MLCTHSSALKERSGLIHPCQARSDSSSTRQKSTRRRIPKWALHSNDRQLNEQYYLRSIGRALEVLDCFDGKAPLTLKEIGKSTGLPESTLFRVLLTLEKHGYLSQAMDGTYQLAPKLRFGWLIESGQRSARQGASRTRAPGAALQ